MTGSFDSLGREKSASSPATTPGAAAGLVPVSDGAGGFTWTALSASGAASDLATQAEIDNIMGAYRDILHEGRGLQIISTTQFGFILPMGIGNNAATAIGSSNADYAVYLDPADYAVSGKTTKIRLKAQVYVNAVAPARTINVGLYAVATWGGASGSAPFPASQGTQVANVAFASPAANAHTNTDTADVTFPVAGFYFLAAVVDTGAIAANSVVQVGAKLQVRNV